MKEIKDILLAYKDALQQGKKTALATVVHVTGSSYRRPGARMLVTEDGLITGAISGGCLEGDALRKAALAISQGKNKLVIYDTTDEDDAKLGIQLGCNGIVSILFEPIDTTNENNAISYLQAAIEQRKKTVLITSYSLNQEVHFGTGDFTELSVFAKDEIAAVEKKVLETGISVHQIIPIATNQQQLFFEYVEPAIALVVVGAGNDAQPLVAMAHLLGWPVTLVDGRHTHATLQRFAGVDKILVGKPDQVKNELSFDPRTAVILMTHNYNYDLDMLALLMQTKVGYIGLLGPASKRDRMVNELLEKGIVVPSDVLAKVYGPTGLNLGAETSNEIALSMVAEIMAVMTNRTPIHLKNKQAAIHQPQL